MSLTVIMINLLFIGQPHLCEVKKSFMLLLTDCMRFHVVAVDTYCQLETLNARCRWNSEVILMTSAQWGRMKTNRCLEIHPNVLTAFGHDPLFLGCSQDVLLLMDSRCSGRSECQMRIPDADLDQLKPCYHDLKSSLTASYSCVTGIIGLRLTQCNFHRA